MRYRELLEAVEEGQSFFHITTKRRLNAIIKHGIEPGHHRRWRGMYGKQLGDRGYIYLISDFPAAVRWAAHMDWDFNKGKQGEQHQMYILCLSNVPTKLLEPDPNFMGQMYYPGKWFQMKGKIPPQDITRVIPLTDELMKQAVDSRTADESGQQAEPDMADA